MSYAITIYIHTCLGTFRIIIQYTITSYQWCKVFTSWYKTLKPVICYNMLLPSCDIFLWIFSYYLTQFSREYPPRTKTSVQALKLELDSFRLRVFASVASSLLVIYIILDGIEDCMRMYCTHHLWYSPSWYGEVNIIHDKCSIFSYNPK